MSAIFQNGGQIYLFVMTNLLTNDTKSILLERCLEAKIAGISLWVDSCRVGPYYFKLF